MTHSLEPGAVAPYIDAALSRLAQFRFAEALWTRTLDIWSTDSSVQQKIGDRLGWLQAAEFVSPGLERVQGFAEGVRAGGFTDVVLLGMGGSSLAPEVMRQVLGPLPGYPRFRMLDSVDPAAVRDAMTHADTSLFVFASKSGGTIEPNVMAAEARRRVEAAGHRPWGSRFVAITDENTALHQRARAEQFRDIFVNPADIGGRYSALSYFGVVPAALMGVDLERLMSGARAMADACRAADPRTNPGVALGAFMAGATEAGRNKLTLIVSPRLASFGLWVEQLIAESTGKQGKGVVPITGEPPGTRVGSDRGAVVVQLEAEPPDAAAIERLRASGAPIFSIHMDDAAALGAEFFRWEVATATCGWLMRINPFDEPNVQQAKDATRALLNTYITTRHLPAPEPHASSDGVRLTLTTAAESRLGSAAPYEFLKSLRAGDYLGLLAYVSPNATGLAAAFGAFRASVGARIETATMFGYGPRYLHSTGQLHKGGPNTGVFIVVVATPEQDMEIPGEPYSFGVLEAAQGIGDFQSLERTGRRALLVQLPKPDATMFQNVAQELLSQI
jgi:glucose-6-phosphate isomerase/transaldolase/glucose-6-phosphate isomerase